MSFAEEEKVSQFLENCADQGKKGTLDDKSFREGIIVLNRFNNLTKLFTLRPDLLERVEQRLLSQ